MFRQLAKMITPYKKTVSWALVGVGGLLLILFVPIEIWMAVIGAALIVVGAILLKG